MRAVSILTGVNTHLDHLGVLSHILNIPLIVTDEGTYQLAKKFYPNFDVAYYPYCELSLDFLAKEFDVIFETGKFWAKDLSSTLKLLYNKTMRFVFCPHGNSDKGHSIQELVSQDISLVYGEHLSDLLKRNGSFQKINQVVTTGNYRLAYYLQNKAFYDEIATKEVFHSFKNKNPLVLYAPTWSNKEHPTSFFTATEAMIEQLGSDFNLLIKLHPFLMEHHPAHVIALLSRYEDHPNTLFLNDFPPIYALLNQCALYIGDYSSIGYDFLFYNKPLVFLPSMKESFYSSPLYRCGLSLFKEDFPHLKQKISLYLEQSSDSIMRQQIYHYAFGKEKSPEQLHLDISKALEIH